jgi:hypothetical protein
MLRNVDIGEILNLFNILKNLKEAYMPKLKNLEINYEQIKDLVLQLDFEQKMLLIKELCKDKAYKENFYKYTEELAKESGIKKMDEEELDAFLHRDN